MDAAAVAQEFEKLPTAETTPTGLPNYWHFSIRRVPLIPAQDLVHLVHPESRFVASAGPADILCLATPAAQADVVVPLLLRAFVQGVDRGPNGEQISNEPLSAPSRWSTNDSGLAKAVEAKLKFLGIREQLCTVHVGSAKEDGIADESWLEFLNTLAQTAGKCEGCLKPVKSFPKPLSRCAKCRSAWYCSRECQKNNWKEHKKVCGQRPKTEPYQFYNKVARTSSEAKTLAQSVNLTLPDERNPTGISYPIRRLVRAGKDTPDNMRLFFGPDWQDVDKSINEQRMLALLNPPQGSPAYVMHASDDRDAPTPSPRPASAEEEKKIQEVRDMQAAVKRRLGNRKEPTNDDIVAILTGQGENWPDKLPLYQLAINTMDQGVEVR
ncbi:hypothetical protein NA57DRAFT_82032 [Rhizodiscina lignyota]|uniref:MYND-type domain-containing protein n=1 Tax=Rhizodiscina lignyota TaxID=1504668 RepID=A0A9P4M4A6_9PEZI|nr:hypothetical protein NA57DRAFT_82032 [Rhizodiscina lignyota]